MINSTTILEVTDDKGVIQLLTNIKCIVILVEPVSPCQNIPQSTGLGLCETNDIYAKYKTLMATDPCI